MAALAADVAIEFDGSRPPVVIQMKGEADTYYRGGLAHHTSGILNLAPVATEEFVGVVWGRPDPNPITTNDLVYVAITGRFFWANTNFTDANYGTCMAMPAAALTDNPADLDATTTGSAGCVGTLDHVASTAVNGWVDISRRTLPTNQ